MKYIQDFKIFEAKNRFYGGAVMVDLEIPNWESITSIIKDEDIYKDMNIGTIKNGIQTKSHVTLLYPVKNNIPYKNIKNVLDSIDNIKIDLVASKIDFFELKDYDVLIIKIKENNILTNIHKKLVKNIPNHNKHIDYNPHITIGYLKKGTAKKYCKSYNLNLKSNTIIYTDNSQKIFKYILEEKLTESNDEKLNKMNELQEFCNRYLAYLTDEGFLLNYTNYYNTNSTYVSLVKEDGTNFKWDDIKDYFLPFLNILNSEYELVDNELNNGNIYIKLIRLRNKDEFYDSYNVNELDEVMSGIKHTIREIMFEVKL